MNATSLGVAAFSRLMAENIHSQRPLYGGAITTSFPMRFQEVFVDPSRDESLVFELLDLKADVADQESASWFLRDLANEQDAEGTVVLEQSGIFEACQLRFINTPAIVTTAIGQMAVSKGRQGREAQNIVKVYLANLRLKDVATDVLVTAYEPMLINPLSGSAAAVGAGLAVPALQSGFMPMAEIFKVAVSNFKVNDWSLFGAAD
ncbi:uncharacterized protein [Primulina huaijiensis]|uniref:uncharacterized protein isoform X2 n=1 Tax=Primulina huaijiensis TaxID=1492673 RepID=UPI003CC79575